MNLTPTQLHHRFDTQCPVYRGNGKRRTIEGVTYTDNFEIVGYTYTPATGFLIIKSQNPLNVEQYRGRVMDVAGFERAVKRASKNMMAQRTRKTQ